MSDATTYLENSLAQHAFGGTAWTQPTSYEVGAFTADPTKSGALTNEVSGNGYARQPLAFSITGNDGTNDAVIEFPAATGLWGSITYVGIFDQLGNMLLRPALTTAKTIEADDILRFNVNEITATIGS